MKAKLCAGSPSGAEAPKPSRSAQIGDCYISGAGQVADCLVDPSGTRIWVSSPARSGRSN